MNNQAESNQKENQLNEPQAEAIADLPVAAEQAEQAKGGVDRPMEMISVNFTKIDYK